MNRGGGGVHQGADGLCLFGQEAEALVDAVEVAVGGRRGVAVPAAPVDRRDQIGSGLLFQVGELRRVSPPGGAEGLEVGQPRVAQILQRHHGDQYRSSARNSAAVSSSERR